MIQCAVRDWLKTVSRCWSALCHLVVFCAEHNCFLYNAHQGRRGWNSLLLLLSRAFRSSLRVLSSLMLFDYGSLSACKVRSLHHPTAVKKIHTEFSTHI